MLIIGRQLKVNNHPPSQDSFLNNTNLVNLMKVLVHESYRERIFFTPVDILCKCVIVSKINKKLVIVPNNCRFEMD